MRIITLITGEDVVFGFRAVYPELPTGKTSQLVQPAARRRAAWLMPLAAGGSMALTIPVQIYSRKAEATTLLPGIPHGKYIHVSTDTGQSAGGTLC